MNDFARAIGTIAGIRARELRARMSRAAAIAAGIAIACFAPAPGVMAATVEAHGALDAFAGHGVAMAWGVLRGRDDASTLVVVRVDADPARYRSMAVAGIDPFTRAAQVIVAPAAVAGTRTVRLPRARFADLPRTEWRFYTGVAPAAGDAPALVVEYHGVPDTTPEFDDEATLAASLAERIARARRGATP
ncbi:MAG TPA: hypothetical protein VN947_13590 [Polyangia bacterium]|jgi:hypothetical protein|nr:hypothetical protein [Polyangia bacterium]